MRALLVEDDAALRETLQQALRGAGHGVDPALDGAEADVALAAGTYDLVVLDLGLPHLDGLEVLRRLRGRGDATPVLILTARDGIDERVLGLRSGADDYLTKPFALAEFEARIEALLRRSAAGASRLVNGPLELDLGGHQALIDGVPLELTARELTILEALMRRVGQVVIKTRLANQISEWDREIGSNTIEVYVHRLRRKLAHSGMDIRTIHGLGYLLKPYDGL